eukprot:4702016-Prymnesium_polylepis.1
MVTWKSCGVRTSCRSYWGVPSAVGTATVCELRVGLLGAQGGGLEHRHVPKYRPAANAAVPHSACDLACFASCARQPKLKST